MKEQEIDVGCPHCGFSKKVPRSSVPEGTLSATCPSCRRGFSFTPPELSVQSAPAMEETGPEPVSPLPPQVPSPPPPGGSGGSIGPAPAAAAAPFRPRTLSFSFQGSGKEYFGIWIVNTLLKIATVGFYSAWAKVRKRRYFYGSTKLDGEQFEYTADPMALFKGWLIGAAAFLIYIIGNKVSPVLSMVTGIIFFLAVPWLIVRSRMFNFRNSNYKNIRFAFRANYREAYLVYLGFPLLTSLVIGLGMLPVILAKKEYLPYMGMLIPVFFLLILCMVPYIAYRQKKFLVENSSYGTTPFTFETGPGSFYLLYLKVFGVAVLSMIAFFIIMQFVIGGNLFMAGISAGKAKPPTAQIFIMSFVFFLFYAIPGIYYQTSLTNLTWNKSTLSGCSFKCSLRTMDMLWLYLSNAVAIACTLGLLIPWAAVRMARYRFEHLDINVKKELREFLARASREEISATGEEIGDIFGVDVDFGF